MVVVKPPQPLQEFLIFGEMWGTLCKAPCILQYGVQLGASSKQVFALLFRHELLLLAEDPRRQVSQAWRSQDLPQPKSSAAEKPRTDYLQQERNRLFVGEKQEKLQQQH